MRTAVKRRGALRLVPGG